MRFEYCSTHHCHCNYQVDISSILCYLISVHTHHLYLRLVYVVIMCKMLQNCTLLHSLLYYPNKKN